MLLGGLGSMAIAALWVRLFPALARRDRLVGTAVILHADATLLVADKPAGLPTVPGRPVELHDCLWQRVRDDYADALVVHRLDMATSGLVLFARGIEAQRALSRAFAQREVDKRYEAVVAARWQPTAARSICPWPPTGRTGRARRSTASTASPSLTRCGRPAADRARDLLDVLLRVGRLCST